MDRARFRAFPERLCPQETSGLDAQFLLLTASAHLVFGLVLGTWCRWRLATRPAAAARC